jgi:hypothetical protein
MVDFDYTELLLARIDKANDTITALEGMVKELADMLCKRTDWEHLDWLTIIAAAPIDDPAKLHEVIKAAMSFRKADSMEVEDASDPNLS